MPRNGSSSSDRPAADPAPRLLRRRRLLRRLDVALEVPLTVLVGPAGAGKSVLARQWVGDQRHVPTAWVQLERETDAAHVAAGLVAGATRLGADVGDAVRDWAYERSAVLGRRFARALASSLESIGDALLVLDALDAPDAPALVRELEALVADLPANIHVLVTRRGRGVGARHRRQRAPAVVVGGTELAFDHGEARLLVRREAGRTLSTRQVDLLLERTEGWAFGLQVAVGALRGTGDPDAAIDAVRGDVRRIAAFLDEEVLDRQPPRVRRFLLRASVLDGLTGPLCRAVVQDQVSDVILRRLERDNVFVRRGPSGDGRYRLHGLFRELLRSELRRTDPEAEGRLLDRAASWHLRRDEPDAAASYLVAAERWDQVVDLLDRYGRRLFERGMVPELLRWQESMPLGGCRRRHQILQRAYLLTMSGRTRQADELLHDLDGSATKGEQLVIDALRSAWAFFDASPAPVLSAADAVAAAVTNGPALDVPDVLGLTAPADLVYIARGSRARASWYSTQVATAWSDLLMLAADRDAYPPWRVHVLGALALLEAWAGRLHAADRHARVARAVAAGNGLLHHPAMHDPYLAIAHVRCERGRLGAAEDALARARATVQRVRRPVATVLEAVELATWCQVTGEAQLGIAGIRAHRSASEAPAPPIIEDRLRAVEGRLLVALGETEQAALVVAAAPRPLSPELTAVATQVAFLGGDRAAARCHLDSWKVGDEDRRSRLARDLWTAILDFYDGRRGSALRRAARVVADAAGDGQRLLFLDAGPPGRRLMRSLLQHGAAPAVGSLVEALTGTVAVGVVAPEGSPPVQAFSLREQEIVRYLPTPLSRAQIAARLYISMNTLKTHLRMIYRKFGVSDRQGAVRRAQDLGMA